MAPIRWRSSHLSLVLLSILSLALSGCLLTRASLVVYPDGRVIEARSYEVRLEPGQSPNEVQAGIEATEETKIVAIGSTVNGYYFQGQPVLHLPEYINELRGDGDNSTVVCLNLGNRYGVHCEIKIDRAHNLMKCSDASSIIASDSRTVYGEFDAQAPQVSLGIWIPSNSVIRSGNYDSIATDPGLPGWQELRWVRPLHCGRIVASAIVDIPVP